MAAQNNNNPRRQRWPIYGSMTVYTRHHYRSHHAPRVSTLPCEIFGSLALSGSSVLCVTLYKMSIEFCAVTTNSSRQRQWRPRLLTRYVLLRAVSRQCICRRWAKLGRLDCCCGNSTSVLDRLSLIDHCSRGNDGRTDGQRHDNIITTWRTCQTR